MTTLCIKAFMGDYGDSVAKVTVTTVKKLTELAVPSLEDADLVSDFIETESWAIIYWEDDYVDERVNEDDAEEEDSWFSLYNEYYAPPEEPFIGIAFTSGEEPTYVRALYRELDDNLLMRIRENCYEEITKHSGADSTTEYVYTLHEGLFT